jgi:GTP pyrophosphokinase
VAKEGGPSRDWLNPSLGYLITQRARAKVRAWFSNLALEETLAEGRGVVTKELQRLGQGGVNIDDLAVKLGFAKAEDLFIAAGRNELSMRQFQVAVRGSDMPADERGTPEPRRRKAPDADRGILIVGVDKFADAVGTLLQAGAAR